MPVARFGMSQEHTHTHTTTTAVDSNICEDNTIVEPKACTGERVRAQGERPKYNNSGGEIRRVWTRVHLVLRCSSSCQRGESECVSPLCRRSA